MAALRAASLLALVFAAPWLASADCPDPDCLHCIDNDPWRCTECAAGYYKYGSEGICYYSGSHYDDYCSWEQEDEDAFWQKLLVGTIIGGIIAGLMVIIASLPVCCGVMKNSSSLKAIGVIVGLVAGFCVGIPAITGSVAGSAAVDDYCHRVETQCGSGCTESERENAKDAVAALGIIFAYIPALGFIVVILAIVALSLSCCMCCPCCGPLQAAQEAKAQGAGAPAAPGAPAAVVGVPVNNQVGCENNQVV